MNKLNVRQAGRSRSRGLSLIELMISIVIGLVVTIAAVAAYTGSAGAARMAEAQVRMNEDAQAALNILAVQVRMAGNNPKRVNYTNAMPSNPVYDTTTFVVRGCDGTFGNVTSAATIPALTCAGGGSPDSIAVSYEADAYNTIGNAAVPTDCLGQSLSAVNVNLDMWTGAAVVSTPVTYYVADNRFYIAPSSGAPSLFCKGNGGANPQALVENVEDLQFVYGTAPKEATSTLSVSGYIGADAITALAAPLTTDAQRWSKVLTVRICVLVRSERPVVAEAGSAQYVDCGGGLVTTATDGRLRRAYSTTVVLRNRAPPTN
jgi:type IV pilus assembly protein PilW